jgi:hypothetical protein
LLLAAESSEDEATVLVEVRAQEIAVTGERASGGDLLALVAEVLALDLDVMAAQCVAGDGGGDLEQEQWARLGLEDQIRRRRNARLHDASWSSSACCTASASTVFLLARTLPAGRATPGRHRRGETPRTANHAVGVAVTTMLPTKHAPQAGAIHGCGPDAHERGTQGLESCEHGGCARMARGAWGR